MSESAQLEEYEEEGPNVQLAGEMAEQEDGQSEFEMSRSPTPEDQSSRPLTPIDQEALEEELEVLGTNTTGNPSFSAGGSRVDP